MTKDRGALMGSGRPDPLDAVGATPAVLAFHGFGATPLEMSLVIEVAREAGLRAHAPLLPGHGTHARDLANTGWNDWVRSAEEALDRVAPRGSPPVVVVGLSMGSLLAAHLAATYPERVRALAMLANATRLARLSTDIPLRIVDALRVPDFWLPKVGADIADPEARATHLTYGTQPVHAALEVLRGGEYVESILWKITCPAFIAHGRDDHVCPVDNAERVAKGLGSSDKTVLILPRSFHIITRDYDRETLRKELYRFIARFRKDGPG